MKKIISFFACFILFTVSAEAQDISQYFVDYEAFDPYQSRSNNRSNYQQQQRKQRPQVHRVQGYYYSNGSWRSVKLKVQDFVNPGTGIVSPLVVGYCEMGSDYWQNVAMGYPSKVSRYSDGEVAADNFEWRTEILTTPVYFNY